MTKKCLFKPTAHEGEWICSVCGVLTPNGRVYSPDPPFRPCPAKPQVTAPRKHKITVFVGQILKGKIERLQKWFPFMNLSENDECPCKNIAAQMDAWGVQGCKENLKTIVKQMHAEAKRRKLPVTKFVIRRVVLSAIREAEQLEKKLMLEKKED